MRNILSIYIPLAALCAVLTFFENKIPYSFLKPIPIALLAYLVWQRLPDQAGRWLLTGLMLSVLGDICIELPFEPGFVLGLGSFLLAHIAYTVSFLYCFEFRPGRLPHALAVFVVSVAVAAGLTGATGDLMWPVNAYISSIAVMTIAAAFRDTRTLMVFIGAVCFMISDTLIAWNRFVGDIYGAGLWVMAAYYTAQALVAIGSIRDHDGRPGNQML